jgi:chromosome segregation ATPase
LKKHSKINWKKKKKINECLEAKIVLQRKELEKEEEEVVRLNIKVKEEEKREEILTSHLKEIYENLNKLEVEFSQQERIFEEEIISLKTQLEEAKRMKEVMKIQMMKKEEYSENIEEEVISLRVEVEKLIKNLKRSQVLEGILSCQRSPFDKEGFGYIGEASCK